VISPRDRKAAATLASFEQALTLATKAEGLKAAYQLAGRLLRPATGNRLLGAAVMAEDAAREAANRVRLSLGGEAVPDPADPPPARPDD
jgi:hypothetical protein